MNYVWEEEEEEEEEAGFISWIPQSGEIFNLTIVENKNRNEQLYKQSISVLCSRLN